MLRQITFPISQ